MNKYISILIISCLAIVGFSSCDSEQDVHYEGVNYVLFSDSIMDMPITIDESKTFDLYIGTTTTVNYDRNYIVDVNVKKTNAIEGYHFDIISRNICIKAGERQGKVSLKGYYNNIDINDSLAITLEIIGAKFELLSMYGNSTNIQLHKCMPFNIEDYVGYMRMSATWPFNTSQITQIIVETVKKDDKTLVIKEPFDDTHDLTIKFHDAKKDPFDTTIDVGEQIAFIDANYGEIAMQTVEGTPSFYSQSERGFALYLNAFIPRVGSFGNYYYVFEWITPEEAEAEKNGISSPF